jgi:UDP-perosamine 4-acetyltransferase
MRSLVVIGGGGHAKVLIEALLSLGVSVSGYTDLEKGDPIQGVCYWGTDDQILRHNADKIQLVNGVGMVKSSQRRADIFRRFKQLGYSFATVIHNSAVIARGVELGEGVQIMAGAIVQPGCNIGANSIINTRAAVDHDAHIGENVHIAPGATLSGGVVVEDGAHVGTGATIIQNIRIGANSTVGAGAVVIKNIPPNVTVIGVPARILNS